MKKLFLASVACNVLETFVEFLDESPSNLTIAFIPTAADPYENKYFVDIDRDELLRLGFKVIDINIVGKTEDTLQKLIQNVDILFVSGGNTFYLLEKTRESGFDQVVKNHVAHGKWYIGSSAGSVLVGENIEPVKLIDDPSKATHLTTFEGLKLIDRIILPHFGNEKYQEKIQQILVHFAHLKNSIITLTDDQAVMILGEEVKIVQTCVKNIDSGR